MAKMPDFSRKQRPLNPLPATDSLPNNGPGDFPIGSLESRAAARALLEGNTRQRLEFIHYVPIRPIQDMTKPHATPWVVTQDGELFRLVYVPADMDTEEAQRILREHIAAK